MDNHNARTTSKLLSGLLHAALIFSAQSAVAKTEHYTVIFRGTVAGHSEATTTGNHITSSFEFKQNGRGPSLAETMTLDDKGLPTAWTIKGATTYGSKLDEHFTRTGNHAEWLEPAGKFAVTVNAPSLYVAQTSGGWDIGMYARALMKAPGGKLSILPGGTLRLQKGESFKVTGTSGTIAVTPYAIFGLDLNPTHFLLDANGDYFGSLDPNYIEIRKGFEKEDPRLRTLAAKLNAERYTRMQTRLTHQYSGPVRIQHVKLFDPKTLTLSDLKSVVMRGNRISAIEAEDSPVTPGETLIDGAGGTLVAGMTDMHAHLGSDDAMLNVLGGVTSVRDMGNDNAVLDALIADIDTGKVAGPRVTRSGFIEGKSKFSALNGILVDNQKAAIDAVRWYGARGYWQIKIYNSMNPAWVPAMVAEAHTLGMRVAGHVPAFSNADAMIEAGYDEMTHINQFMLGWVLKPDEDTRSLLRFTAMKRFVDLDLTSAPVQHTINMMVERYVAIDPTAKIHEHNMLIRDGQAAPSSIGVLDHMPISYQRDQKQAQFDMSAPGDDVAYRKAYEKIISTIKILHERGVFIVPGTDSGELFSYQRELEIYEHVGMTRGEILKLATYDVAKYLGQDQQRGSIEKAKLADFFLVEGNPLNDLRALKAISMVVKDGTVYFPSEIYPEFGIKPFASAPKVTPVNGIAQK